ncbi:MAG: serine/threonine protein kinase [Planctomycetaceae bacterium]|nr:serine/threonine protein kinase [Planctomycetaceae bacterium]MCB9950168.1 serine/threonine protein kinase [Planctomycetaceae bacterium]
MAAPKTGREFMELVRKSQVLSEEVLAQLQPQLAKYLNEDAKRVAKTLVSNRLLSEYQAKNLLAGRYQGFYIGKYRVLDLLGRGGMGKVYLAEQLAMERLVAVKVISSLNKKQRKEDALARFRREAKAVAALNHQNIVHAYDFEEQGGSPYIVMEFVEGIDLATLVGKSGPIAPEFAADMMRQAIAGLHEAHKAGMVHRDVKPGNLLIDAAGGVHILDLGLCTLQSSTSDSITMDQDQLGTVDYIAPEQSVNSSKVDHRADFYGLAATIYSAMRGDVMFPGYTTTQKLIAHQNEEPEDIRKLVPGIPEGFAQLLHQMLAKNPNERPASGVSIYKDLKDFAKRPARPFDPALIPVRKKNFEGLLGKGPEASELQAMEATEADSSSSSTTVASPSSVIAGQSGVFDEAFSTEDFGDDQQATMLDLPTRKSKKKKKTKAASGPAVSPLALTVGGIALVLIIGVFILRSTLLSAPEFDKSDVHITNNTAATSNANGHMVPLSIRGAANTNSTFPMFYDKKNETFVLDNWAPRMVNGTNFELIDPTVGNRPNLILLYGTQGEFPPEKPKSVTVVCNRVASRIHLLSGVAGWAFPLNESQDEVMRVRLKYASGETEDHPLYNGLHFADYIKRIDVPQSQFAFEAQGHQMRQITITPKKSEEIQELEFLKGPAVEIAPIVMAVTVEEPN